MSSNVTSCLDNFTASTMLMRREFKERRNTGKTSVTNGANTVALIADLFVAGVLSVAAPVITPAPVILYMGNLTRGVVNYDSSLKKLKPTSSEKHTNSNSTTQLQDRINRLLKVKGLIVRIRYSEERIIGYEHANNLFSPAPNADGNVDDATSYRYCIPAPLLENGRPSGTEIVPGKPSYVERETTITKHNRRVKLVVLFIPANGGYVPVLHGGHSSSGDWISSTSLIQHVYDSNAFRHPAYPGVNYEKHGFKQVVDWKQRTIWWPKKNEGNPPTTEHPPTKLPKTYCESYYLYSRIPLPERPAVASRFERFLNIFDGISYSSQTSTQNSSGGAEVNVWNCWFSVPSRGLRLLMGYNRKRDEQTREIQVRNDRQNVLNEDVTFQREHNRKIQEALASDVISIRGTAQTRQQLKILAAQLKNSTASHADAVQRIVLSQIQTKSRVTVIKECSKQIIIIGMIFISCFFAFNRFN